MEINREELKEIVKDVIKEEIGDNLKINHTVYSEDGAYYSSVINLYYNNKEISESRN